MFPNQNNRFNNTLEPKRENKEDRVRINDEIKSFKVLLIDQDGNNVGVISNRDALQKSKEAGLDLVEVAPLSVPPVCRIMDFRKYLFEQKKKAKENNHKSPEPHELRLSPNIGQNDLEIKAKKAIEFLLEGSKVNLTFNVKGREASKTELIRGVVARFFALVEKQATMESKGGVYTLTPK